MDYSLFYELIQISLGTREDFSRVPTADDWIEMYKESDRQTIVGVTFCGVEKIVKLHGGCANTTIEPDLFASWYSYVQKLEERNIELNEKCVWLQNWLDQVGMHSCVLKGQGNSLLYPNPFRRTSGDIDIWMWWKKFDRKEGDTKYYGKENRLEIIKWVQKKVNGEFAEIASHHIQMPPLGDVEVEGHYWPTNMFSFISNRRFEHWCEEEHIRQMTNWQELPGGVGKISAPTTEFNIIFQLIHIMRHFFHDGIGLRQMIDFFWLLQSKDIDIKEVTRLLNLLRLNNVLKGVMWIMTEVFRMDKSLLPFPSSAGIGRQMLKEIERGANLGHDDRDIAKWRYESKLKIFVWRTYRNIRFARISPSEVLWSPIFRFWQRGWMKKMYEMGEIKSEK